MIHASLLANLATGQLGPFVPLSSRDIVLKELGPPPYWDAINHEVSSIWVYDSIQCNFEDALRLADTHIRIESTLSGSTVAYHNWNNAFLALDDLRLDSICTPDLFPLAMTENSIATTQIKFPGGQILVNTQSGVQARFHALSDVSFGIKYGVRNQNPVPCLHRISTVKWT